MCGIVGFNLQNKDALNLTLKSLHFLEYRGYDSAGVAFLLNNNIKLIKTAGRVLLLEEMCKNFTQSSLAIGHTRWATHGKPTSINAHPHYSQNIHLVHNGIIENYQEIKKSLIEDGYNFQSETDTEVIAHFLHKTLKSTNIHQAISLIFEKLHGKYAIALII